MYWLDKTLAVWVAIIWMLVIMQAQGANKSCPLGFFECHDGECINSEKHCDGKHDCRDNSDEFDCDYILCKSPVWFQCANKNCVSGSFRCDEADDCGDWSDEENCHLNGHTALPVKCSSQEWRCLDNNCIAKEWVCDGKKDCMDGSDEIQGCSLHVKCEDGGFLCDNHHCVPETFKCDGSDDCGDGSDEKDCHKAHEIDTEDCLLEKELFLCHDNLSCMPLKELCDGVAQCLDSSDEGPGCKTPCKDAGCSHKCVPSPRGPLCYCPSGFELRNKTCVDKDECLQYGICDQKCRNLQGSYVCYCVAGYKLADDKQSCKATGAEVLLLFASTREIRAYYLNKHLYYPVATKLNHAVGLAYDGTHIYWTQLLLGEEAIVRVKDDGRDMEMLVTAGLYAPEDLSVDWITGNIYFTDSLMHHIAACSNNGTACTVLLHRNLNKTRGIALIPNEGYMFWSDWGLKPFIGKAGMDGSDPINFITSNIHFPNGLTVDYPNSRLYWVDAKLAVIESVKLDGTDRRTILEGVLKHPFAIAVFEDSLYWSDWHGRDIQACNKFTGKDHRIIVREKNAGDFIYDINVYHPSDMPKSFNPCEHAACSDMCLLAPNKSYACACPEYKFLLLDKHTCRELMKQDTIIVGAGHKMIQVGHQFLGKQEVYEMSFQNIKQIGALAYNSLTGHVLISDSIQHKLYSLDLKAMRLISLPISGIGIIEGMDFDPLGNNLYWCDSQWATVEVLSLNTMEKTVLLHSMGGEAPMDIAVVPEEGEMFVAFASNSGTSGPHIDKMHMDGKGTRVHFVESGLEGIISLIYDGTMHRIFWSDSNTGKIDSSSVDGVSQHLFRSIAGTPLDVAALGLDLFWTEWGQPYLYWSNKLNTISRIKRIALDIPDLGAEKMKLVAVLGTISPPEHPCHKKNGGCSHICVVVLHHMACLCPIGMVMKPDNKTCANPVACKADEFKCSMDNLCIPRKWRCDDRLDCPIGHEDESDCDEFACRDNEFLCHDKHCISDKFKCDGKKDCLDGSDELHCEHKCTEFQFECDDGDCIEMRWRCDATKDCKDGSDEKNCQEVTCAHGDFRCTAGSCISAQWVCDGEADCLDGSDEQSCAPKTCGPGTFACNNGRCIDKQLLCNEVDDCGDHSDEIPCEPAPKPTQETPVKCKASEFTCAHETNQSVCVPMSSRCNGIPECPYGDDEKSCDRCQNYEFECHTKKCIMNEWVCDGANDCGDGSDEDPEMCHSPKATEGPCREYSCQSGECIPLSAVCNRHWDCKDGSDEGDACLVVCYEKVCDQICHPTPQGHICSCNKGYRLLDNGRHCEDVNECFEDEPCAQNCENTPGSFTCFCDPEYMLRSDRISCKAIGAPVEYIYAAGHRIVKVSHELRNVDVVFPEATMKITGLDVLSATKTIVWSSGDTGAIYSISLLGGKRDQVTGLQRPGELAVDWVTRNVYYVENVKPEAIYVCNLDSHFCAKVHDLEEGYNVAKIVVDPITGYMFWAQVSYWYYDQSNSEIVRSGLAGNETLVLPSDHAVSISGLALDVQRQRVYWIDEAAHVLGSISYWGQDHKVILESPKIQDPVGLALFEGTLYWMTAGSGQLTSYKLYGAKDRRFRKMELHSYGSDHFSILQTATQWEVPNRCENITCAELCVLNSYGETSCLCSDGRHVEMNERCEMEGYSARIPHPPTVVKQSAETKAGIKGVVIGIIIALAFIALLFAAYYYRHSIYNRGQFNISMHFQNPSFGLRPRDEMQSSQSSQALIPGQHQYTNPFDSSVVVEHPEGKVVILTGKDKRTSPMILRIPRRQDNIDLEDADPDFIADGHDTMKTPLIS